MIGIGIGAKYAIDHQLISPVTRIALGYLPGFVLIFFALWLKNTHSNKFVPGILAGKYALMLIVLGMNGKKRDLRIAAIA